MISRPALILLLLSQVLLLLFLWQQFQPTSAPERSTPVQEAPTESNAPLPDDWVGEPLPDVPLQVPGGKSNLRGVRGPAVVEFISTSCPFCQKMAPRFDRVMREAPARFLVVGVGSESLGSMRSWHTQRLGRQMPGSYAVDSSGEAVRTLGLIGTPTTLFVDRQGRVQFFVAGELSENEIVSLLRKTIS